METHKNKSETDKKKYDEYCKKAQYQINKLNTKKIITKEDLQEAKEIDELADTLDMLNRPWRIWGTLHALIEDIETT